MGRDALARWPQYSFSPVFQNSARSPLATRHSPLATRHSPLACTRQLALATRCQSPLVQYITSSRSRTVHTCNTPSPSPPPHPPTHSHARTAHIHTPIRARTDSLTTLVRICTPKPTTAIAAGVSEAELRAAEREVKNKKFPARDGSKIFVDGKPMGPKGGHPPAYPPEEQQNR